jgi:iron-sulfur cluster assembly accessory protein
MISISEKASEKMKDMASDNNCGPGIRVAVVGGGCSGLSYDMDFENEVREGDEVFETAGVKLYVDPMSIAYLDGTKIDYIQTFKFSGFHFENPNSSKSCGCGSSFAV